MIGIRFHGRGGQGAVLASKILARAYFTQGFYVQSFPSFGMERKGAAIAAFVRVDASPIVERGQIEDPSIVVVLDPTLLQMVDVTQGVRPGGIILLNYPAQNDCRPLAGPFQIAAVDAGSIALEYGLGTEVAPIVNTVILGALPQIVDNLDLEHLIAAIKTSVPVNPDNNTAAAHASYSSVRWMEGQSTAVLEIAERSQKTPQSRAALPTVPETLGTIDWNQTGSWRYLTPVAANKVPACRSKCPAGMPIPEIFAALCRDQIAEALRLVLSTNPLPNLTGRLCYHPCQIDCLRRKIDRSVSIQQIERFIAAQDFDLSINSPADESARVAVVGAGAVGLTCGYFLGRRGNRVVVLAQESQPGGALLKLPAKKLDPQILKLEVERLVRLSNIELQLGASINREMLAELGPDFDMVIVDPGEFPDLALGQDAIQDLINAESQKNRKTILPKLSPKLTPFKVSWIAHYIAAGRGIAEQAADELAGRKRLSLGAKSVGIAENPVPALMILKPAEIRLERFAAETSPPPEKILKDTVINYDAAVSEAARCLSCGTCNLCLQCISSCPDTSIHRSRTSTGVTFDLYHCKGCGICAHECPRGIIRMEKIVS